MRRDPLLVFDLGNVILRHDNALLTERFIAASSRPEQAATIEDLFAQSGCSAGRVTTEEFFAASGDTLGLPDFAAFEDLWNCHFSHDAGMEQLVTTLAAKYRLVVLSNTNDSHWRYLTREYSIMAVPHALYTSFELGCEKPDPAIYRHVLNAEGYEVSDAIFIDDKLENVVAAKTLGIQGIQFINRAGLERDLAGVRITL